MDIQQEVANRREGFPFEAMTLPELRAALVYAKQPIDWTGVYVPCGVDDSAEEYRISKIEYLEDLIRAHEDKGPSGAIVRLMSEMIRKPYEDQLAEWVFEEVNRRCYGGV